MSTCRRTARPRRTAGRSPSRGRSPSAPAKRCRSTTPCRSWVFALASLPGDPWVRSAGPGSGDGRGRDDAVQTKVRILEWRMAGSRGGGPARQYIKDKPLAALAVRSLSSQAGCLSRHARRLAHLFQQVPRSAPASPCTSDTSSSRGSRCRPGRCGASSAASHSGQVSVTSTCGAAGFLCGLALDQGLDLRLLLQLGRQRLVAAALRIAAAGQERPRGPCPS